MVHAKNYPRRVLKSLGLRLAGSSIPLPYRDLAWLAERHYLSRLMRDVDANVVVDVGANVGQFAAEVRQLGYQGPIVSFEPDPDVFVELSSAMQHDASWVGHNVALGSTDGEMVLYRAAEAAFTSLRERSQTSLDLNITEARVLSTVTVPVRRLDSYAEEIAATVPGLPRVFVKTDTQGFDLEVIRGGPNMLGSCSMLMAEVAVQPLYEGVPDLSHVLGELSALGFRLLHLFPVARGGQFGEILEYDCLLVRTHTQ
jgi:FkbM family methyltransferase